MAAWGRRMYGKEVADMYEILCCQGLTKRYGSILALDNVDLSLESGKIIGLLGPNGSGKTTIIKLINGLLTPDSGTVTVCGYAPGPQSKALVSYLPDSIYLNSWMTVKQIVWYYRDFFPDFRQELAFEMLERLGISPGQRLGSLSKGNKEKVCLILAMCRKAKLYVLDEPIAGVDPAARDYVISTILQTYNPESTVLISTHLIADIEPILDEVVFINRGHIQLQKPTAVLRQETGKSVDEVFREVFRW